MDLQYFGGNCVSVTYKGVRLIFDDEVQKFGGKGVLRSDDIALFTGKHEGSNVEIKLLIDGPGEYEIGDFSIVGIAARSHMDETSAGQLATMYKVSAADVDILITGHIYPEVSNAQLEAVGPVDVMIVPVGGMGYTLDAVGALKLIKEFEPKIVIPVHYSDKGLHYPVPQAGLENAIKELSMEAKVVSGKLKLKSTDLTDTTQLIVLEKST